VGRNWKIKQETKANKKLCIYMGITQANKTKKK